VRLHTRFTLFLAVTLTAISTLGVAEAFARSGPVWP